MEESAEGQKPQKPWTPEDEKRRLIRLRAKEGDPEWAIETGITAHELGTKLQDPEQVFQAIRTARVLGPMFEEILKNDVLTEYFKSGVNIGKQRDDIAKAQKSGQKPPDQGPQNPQEPSPQ